VTPEEPARAMGGIDDVVDRLDGVVAWARANQSRVGYFAALYRRVTVEIRRGIREGRFDDGPRMERLDVFFAARYLEAFERWRDGEPTTRSWAVAFDAAASWWPIVLQHLLLGINAHINLDLGIAAVRTSPGAALPALEDDFLRVNQILSSLVDDVQERLSGVWPLLRVLDWVGGRTDEATVHFSIARARDEAWAFAHRLNGLEGADRQREVEGMDGKIADLGRLVRRPGLLLGTAVKIVRLGELRSVEGVIDLLA